MSSRSIILVAITLAAALAGCSTDSATSSPERSTQTSPTSVPTGSAAPAPTTATPPVTSSPGEPSSPSNGTEVTAADGSVTWTLPCSDPADQDMALNDKDKKDLVRVDAWRCGEPPTTTAAVFVAQLRKAPGTEDDAHRALRAAAQQMVRGDEPEHGAFQGHPGITNEITRNGKEYAYQGVSFGPYLVFFVAPADKLSAVTDTVRISA